MISLIEQITLEEEMPFEAAVATQPDDEFYLVEATDIFTAGAEQSEVFLAGTEAAEIV